METNKPTPVAFFERVKGIITREAPNFGKVHRLAAKRSSRAGAIKRGKAGSSRKKPGIARHSSAGSC